MRNIHVDEITDAVKKLCIEANYYLPKDVYDALQESQTREVSPVGKSVLEDILVLVTV